MDYFSDRERGPAPRTVEEVTPEAWAGIWALISARLSDSSFGHSFPEQCRESNGISGYDSTLFEGTAAGHGIIWPITKDDVPDTLDVMDILEFVANPSGEADPARLPQLLAPHPPRFRCREGQGRVPRLTEQDSGADWPLVRDGRQRGHAAPSPP